MKLRYAHIQGYPPLINTEIAFNAGSPLNRACGIRFVVGGNGAGKTHLLLAIAEVFVALSDGTPPRFPVTLIYEIGEGADRRTYVLDNPGSVADVALWTTNEHHFPDDTAQPDFAVWIRKSRSDEAPVGWKMAQKRGQWAAFPQLGAHDGLPKAVLAYTTGDPGPWRAAWKRNAGLIDPEADYDFDIERPAGWTDAQEVLLSAGEVGSQAPVQRPSTDILRQGFRHPLLVDKLHLSLALLAVTLPGALADLRRHADADARRDFIAGTRARGERETGLDSLLARLGWVWPVTVAVTVAFEPELWSPVKRRQVLDWFEACTYVVAEPAPSRRRTLYFDLDGPDRPFGKSPIGDGPAGYGVFDLLGGEHRRPYDRFLTLLDLWRDGILEDLRLAIRKAGTDDLLLFDELSDGEQSFLGRLALMHLLEGQHDALLILDEPETHFNDRWKRELVDIIDQVLGDTRAEVFISTHSGIALTDVFGDEIVILDNVNGNAQWVPLAEDIHTFGATPDHSLRDVFGARGTVGLRASTLLDVLLQMGVNRQLVESFWERDGEASAPLEEFIERVVAKKAYLTPERVKRSLDGIAHFTRLQTGGPVTVEAALEAFADNVGPGHYQFNLYRELRRIQSLEGDNAP